MPGHARQPRPPGVGYDFARRVQAERLRRGWSKTDLHLKCGVSRGTLDNLGFGSKPPLVATVDAVANALDIPREEAYKLAGLGLPEWQPAVDASAPVRAAIEASPTFTDEQKRMLLAMVRTLDAANARSVEPRSGDGYHIRDAASGE